MNHKYHVIAVAATLALAGVCFEVHAIGPTPPSWEPRELVTDNSDWADHAGADRYLAYDHHGNAAVAFFRSVVDQGLHFAREVPGVGWVDGDTDSQVIGNSGGRFPSLAFDRYERPAISAERLNGDISFHHLIDATWDVSFIDSITAVGDYSALAFDVLGRPAVAWRDPDVNWFRFIGDTDGDLRLDDEVLQTVSVGFGHGRQPSMVFDPLNRPMIAHHDVFQNNLQFSVREPGVGWITTTVEDWGFFNTVGRSPSIAIDPDTGFPAIAYTSSSTVASSDELHFAQWDGEDWVITVVDDVGNTGLYTSLAFDPADGNPAISYRDETNQALKLAWHDGSAWNTQTVDSVGDVGYSTSLAFNDFGTGFPSIAYFEEDGATDNIYFIEDPLPVPEPGTFLLAGLGLLSLGGSAWARHLGPISRAP